MPTYTLYLQTWANNMAYGSIQWFNPGNAENVDGSVAKTNAITGSNATYYLEGTNPSPISPGGNEILTEIQATVTRACGGGLTTDGHFYLVVGGALTTSDDKAQTSIDWPGSLGAATYMWVASELAALGVTLATVQQSNFGVALAANLTNVTGQGAVVDAIVLTLTTIYAATPSGNNVLPPYGVR